MGKLPNKLPAIFKPAGFLGTYYPQRGLHGCSCSDSKPPGEREVEKRQTLAERFTIQALVRRPQPKHSLCVRPPLRSPLTRVAEIPSGCSQPPMPEIDSPQNLSKPECKAIPPIPQIPSSPHLGSVRLRTFVASHVSGSLPRGRHASWDDAAVGRGEQFKIRKQCPDLWNPDIISCHHCGTQDRAPDKVCLIILP